MKRSIFALVDCNNFFVSCEKVFRPDLEGKPVVVLSSGDGCVVARSNEAKALGIPMGAPVFKHKQLFERYNVIRFSGNFDLYGDISRRITELLTTITPKIEVYSVDESFLDLSELPVKDYTAWGKEVRSLIFKWVGVPVSIGIAPTKTLAKLASERAKKDPGLSGALYLEPAQQSSDKHLTGTPIRDVWGVGRKLAPKLQAYGVLNASDLANLNPRTARQLFGSVHGEQLVRELGGTSCFPLPQAGKLQKSIARTRTFGEDTNDFKVLEAAIVNFAAKAAYHLRREGQLARRAGFFITTNRHKPGYSSRSGEMKLDVPSSDTGLISQLLVGKLQTVFRPGLWYHRAGVMLSDFVPQNALQTAMFGGLDPLSFDKSAAKLKALDQVNARWGSGTLHYAAEDLAKSWQPKHNLRSPAYTSDWNKLPTVKIQ